MLLSRRYRLLLKAVTLFIALGASRPALVAADWPPVAPLRRTYHFSNARNASVVLTIVGLERKPLYRFECHNRLYQRDPTFDYSGDFECRLMPLYTTTTYSTLFTEIQQQTRDWESRARFFVSELAGRCGDFAEYGRVRTFRFRGMSIRLSLGDIDTERSVETTLDPSFPLRSFRFSVAVTPDASAVSEIAEPVDAPLPPPECGGGYRSKR
jgi:hypothetical protein